MSERVPNDAESNSAATSLKSELSLLMDAGAADVSDADVGRIMERLAQRSEQPDDASDAHCALQAWRRYHISRSVMRGELSGKRLQGAVPSPSSGELTTDLATLDLTASIAAAIENEPTYQAAATPLAHPDDSSEQTAQVIRPSVWQRIRPLTNMAVAASVTAVVVLGWQTVQGPNNSGGVAPVNGAAMMAAAPVTAPASKPATVKPDAYDNAPIVASRSVAAAPVSVAQSAVSMVPRMSTNTSSGFMSVADGQLPVAQSKAVLSADRFIRMPRIQNERLNRYLMSHSGNSMLNTASGPVSYARALPVKP